LRDTGILGEEKMSSLLPLILQKEER